MELCTASQQPAGNKNVRRLHLEWIFIFPHISYGKGKYLNQTVFFNKICQAPNLYLTLRVLPIEFNSQKFSFVRFVFVDISELFLADPNDPRMTQK